MIILKRSVGKQGKTAPPGSRKAVCRVLGLVNLPLFADATLRLYHEKPHASIVKTILTNL